MVPKIRQRHGNLGNNLFLDEVLITIDGVRCSPSTLSSQS